MKYGFILFSFFLLQNVFAGEHIESPTFNSVFAHKEDLVGKPGAEGVSIKPFEYQTDALFTSTSSVVIKKEKLNTLFPDLSHILQADIEPKREEGQLPFQAFGNRLSPNCTLAMSLRTASTDSDTVTLDPATFTSVNAKYLTGINNAPYYLQQFHVSRKNKQTHEVKELGDAYFVCKGTTPLSEATELLKNKLGVVNGKGISFFLRFNSKPVERHVEVKTERGVAGKIDP